MSETQERVIIGENDRRDRVAFWDFCKRAAPRAQHKAKKRGLPYSIDAFFLDRLLVDQDWRCAVSGMPLSPPQGRPGPFSPSVDRIIPALGYVSGNVRIVCLMVNMALSEWGEEAFHKLIDAASWERKR